MYATPALTSFVVPTVSPYLTHGMLIILSIITNKYSKDLTFDTYVLRFNKLLIYLCLWHLLNEPPDLDSFRLIQLPSTHTYDYHLNKTFVKLYDNLYQNNLALWQGNISIQK